jgi:AcrR family transcriptional regulator
MAARREEILGAAAQLLHERGHEAVTIRAIAERVGVSHMVLYRYFRNRDDLEEALRERQRARLAARREDDLRRAEAGEVEAMTRRMLGFFRHMAERNPRMYRLIWLEPIESEDGARRFDARAQGDIGHLSRLVELGIAQGLYVNRDPVLAAQVCLALVNGPLLLHAGGRLAASPLQEQVAGEAVEAALGYLAGRALPTPDAGGNGR